jgi:hypothetical protein
LRPSEPTYSKAPAPMPDFIASAPNNRDIWAASCTVLHQFDGRGTRSVVGDNLVAVTVHGEDGHGDLLQVLSLPSLTCAERS